MNCFDLFPWLRPANVHSWPAQMSRMLAPLAAAGARKQRWFSTDILFQGGAGNLDQPALAGYETRDFYLLLPPASFVYAVSVWADAAAQAVPGPPGTNPWLTDNDALEVEIIDACTRESWWRSSQGNFELGEYGYSDDNNVNAGGAIGIYPDTIGLSFGLRLLPRPHVTSDPGTQVVRLTGNAGPAMDAQVTLWTSIPEEAE